MKINQLLKKYRLKFGFTLVLILLEAGISILFPLVIGYAIDDAIHKSYQGAIQLGVLGILALIVGVGRRIFDSRFYAVVFQDISERVVLKIEEKSSSVKTARLGMLRELVEFMENSMPELIYNLIGMIGVVFIIATLSLKVFIGCLISTACVLLIYVLSSSKTIQFNKSYNDEIEKQVDVISTNEPVKLRLHLKELMKWNIKLSDLESLNFSLSWIVLIVFLVMSIVLPIQDGIVQYGTLFSLVMYAFQYIENVINLPFFYQNWLRLKEIQERLEQI